MEHLPAGRLQVAVAAIPMGDLLGSPLVPVVPDLDGEEREREPVDVRLMERENMAGRIRKELSAGDDLVLRDELEAVRQRPREREEPRGEDRLGRALKLLMRREEPLDGVLDLLLDRRRGASGGRG